MHQLNSTKDCNCTHADIRLLSWNVDGLISKLSDSEFINYLSRFNFVCLTETFVEYFDATSHFPDYNCYVSPARKLSYQGRRSGGVICLVDQKLSKYFCRIDVPFDNIVALKCSKLLIQEQRDVIFVCVYVPPQDSPYYDDASDDIAILENCLIDLSTTFSDCLLILCGDFNSRTSDVTMNSEANIHDMLSNVFGSSRKSQDSKVSDFGKMLLSLSLSFNLTILNGLIAGDERGKFTYISPHGNSVIDYFTVSTELLTL